MSPIRKEIHSLSSLAWPVAVTQLGNMLLGTVDTLMLGHLSVEALGASALGNVWTSGVMFAGSGVVLGMDPYVSQAHGAGDERSAALALQRGVTVALLAALPIGTLFFFAGDFLLWTGQDPRLAHAAQAYLLAVLPGMPFFLVGTALRQYLQGRAIVRPAMWTMLAINVINALANWILIFGNLGVPAMGLVGAGLSTALTLVAYCGGLFACLRLGRFLGDERPRLTRANLALRELRPMLRMGLPVAMHWAMEVWAFAGSTLIVGHLGVTAIAAHQIVMNMASLTFMLPLGVSIAASTRVGNLIGGGDEVGMRRTMRVALGMGIGVMSVSATTFVLGREALGRLYTTDPVVVAACASILPIAGAFQVLDGSQVVASGVLRGMGRPNAAALANGVGYWLLALPIGATMALVGGAGLQGIWWAFFGGLSVVNLWLLPWMFRVRPRFAQPGSV